MSFTHVNQILALASETTASDNDMTVLCHKFVSALTESNKLGSFNYANEDAGFDEQSGPCISFDMQFLLSSDFAIEIQPRLSDSKLSAVIRTIRLLDGRGTGSQSYEVMKINGFEQDEEIIADEDGLVSDFFDAFRNEFRQQYLALLGAVGLSDIQALQVVEDFLSKR